MPPPAPPSPRLALPARARDLLPLAAALPGAQLVAGWLACNWPDSLACSRLATGSFGKAILLGLGLWAGLLLIDATRRFLPSDPIRRQRALLVQIVALASVPALLSVVLTAGRGPFVSAYDLQVHVTLAACGCLLLEYRARARHQRADAERLLLEEQALARQLDAARAALLQAQVEPHFLFNTLAHLRRLAGTAPTEARALLADLLRYLEAALPSLRREQTTLAEELDLVRAFLALHQRRLGPERLQLHDDIEPGWDALALPSTCLLTLAENAIKHGIAPQVEGGSITVSVRRAGNRLQLEVADTGAGMGAGAGSGTGLATLRARLDAHHPEARLSLLLNQPRGLIARIEVPA